MFKTFDLTLCLATTDTKAKSEPKIRPMNHANWLTLKPNWNKTRKRQQKTPTPQHDKVWWSALKAMRKWFSDLTRRIYHYLCDCKAVRHGWVCKVLHVMAYGVWYYMVYGCLHSCWCYFYQSLCWFKAHPAAARRQPHKRNASSPSEKGL